jgi:hypothetical protein
MQSCEEDRKDQLGPRDSNERRQAMLKTTKSNNAIIFVQEDDKAQSAYLLLALPLYPTPYMKNAEVPCQGYTHESKIGLCVESERR